MNNKERVTELDIKGKKHIPALDAFTGRKNKTAYYYDLARQNAFKTVSISNSIWVNVEDFERWCLENGENLEGKKASKGDLEKRIIELEIRVEVLEAIARETVKRKEEPKSIFDLDRQHAFGEVAG